MTIKILQEILQQNSSQEQEEFLSYNGKGKWSFVGMGLMVTPKQLNTLFKMADLEPKAINSKGDCNTCQYTKPCNGKYIERGYQGKCLTCIRPSMSNYRKRYTKRRNYGLE